MYSTYGCECLFLAPFDSSWSVKPSINFQAMHAPIGRRGKGEKTRDGSKTELGIQVRLIIIARNHRSFLFKWDRFPIFIIRNVRASCFDAPGNFGISESSLSPSLRFITDFVFMRSSQQTLRSTPLSYVRTLFDSFSSLSRLRNVRVLLSEKIRWKFLGNRRRNQRTFIIEFLQRRVRVQ